jgi:hypothetical protein
MSGRLLKPYATAASSITSTSWKILGRVQGIEMSRASGSVGESAGESVMQEGTEWWKASGKGRCKSLCRRRAQLWYGERCREICMLSHQGRQSCKARFCQKIASTPRNHKCQTKVTYVKGSAQYSENMVATILTTVCNFVSSIAVELIIEGILSTWSSAS